MKILVILARYSVSGVPLAQIRTAMALRKRGHDVDLAFGYFPDALSVPEVPGIRMLKFQRGRAAYLIPDLVQYFRHEKPDVVFSAEDHLNAIVLISSILAKSKAKITCSSRVNPYDHYSERIFSKGWVLKNIMQRLFWRADALTCVSADMVEQYRNIFCSPPHVCVYNIVDTAVTREKASEPLRDAWFEDEIPVCIAVGALAPWKGFQYLIPAMAEVNSRRPARLLILGEGPQREELTRLIAQHNLVGWVRLQGRVDNPLKYMARANVFVLSSLLEGMPNALIEAMMVGCTPIATDCPTGPREMLSDSMSEYLVPMRNPMALARGILKALDAPVPYETLQKAVAPFQEEPVISAHFRALGIQ